MSDVYANRVKETTTTTGTGAVSMGGAVTGYAAFSSVFATGNVIRYAIVSADGSQWEVGKGTLTSGSPWTLSRDVVEWNSSGNTSPITFSAGTKYVWNEVPAGVITLIQTAVQNSRQVLAGGLATGGGDLSADRTVTVTASSNAQARAGTDTTTAMTPASTMAAMAMLLTQFGGL